jgi:hypothetical protein
MQGVAFLSSRYRAPVQQRFGLVKVLQYDG